MTDEYLQGFKDALHRYSWIDRETDKSYIGIDTSLFDALELIEFEFSKGYERNVL